MKFTFVFAGGPLDGNAFHFDTEQFQPLDGEFGGKAWLDTAGGTVGRQFTVMNPDTPKDSQGTTWEFKEHRYEVTKRETKETKVLVHAKHICAIPGSRSGPYEEKFADFIRLLAETPKDVVLVHHPQVLGDTHSEIVESLNRLADAEKKLMLVPRKGRH